MPTSKYLLEQAARCRRLAAHVSDKELQKRLLDLAEEYECKVAEQPEKDPDSRLSVAGKQAALNPERLRAPQTAEDPSRIAEDLESETTET